MIENWNTTLTDAQGERWHFNYAGGSAVRIGPQGVGWTNQVQLDDYGLKPADVTEEWLTERAAEWITNRDKDVAAGNI